MDIFLHQGIVGAAQHTAFDLLVPDQSLQVLLYICIDQRACPSGLPTFRSTTLARSGQPWLMTTLSGAALPIRSGSSEGGSEAGGDDSYLMDIQVLYRVRTRLDYAEHRAAHLIPVSIIEAGNGVAGHQQGLDPLFLP